MNLRRHLKTTRMRCAAGAILVGLTGTALSACGADDNPEAAPSSGGDAACVSTADAFMQDWSDLPTELPEGLKPLAAAPEQGTAIVLTRSNSPADLAGAVALEKATKIVGWTSKSITHDGSPEDVNAKFKQAVSEKPTAILMASVPPAVVQQSIDAAKAAGIVVAISGDPTEPTGYPGYAANTFNQTNFNQNAKILANWALQDSSCDVNAVVVALSLPVLENLATEFKKTLTTTCSSCSAQIVPVQPTDIGSPALVNAVVSAVQADPSVNYVVATLGDVATGLDVALKQAGRGDVKIIGQVPNDSSLQSLQNGTSSMWINYGPTYNTWATLDVAFRALESKQSVFDLPYPVSVMTKDLLPAGYKSGELTYPEDFDAEFAKLWNVG